MKTRVLTVLPLLFILLACNQEDYYEKEFLENPFLPETPREIPGGDQGGSTSGGDNGDTGGSSGDTGGEITDPGSTGGSDGGGTSGGDDEVVGTPHTESFEQKEINTKNVDILWVIDNSGSMDDEQAALGANFSAFIDGFVDSGVDFKMAITTTDVSSEDERGRMVSGAENLNSTYAQQYEDAFKELFKRKVKVGTRGSGREKGIEASYWFMDKHKSFLRPDAYLAVVYMSDEEDQSSGTVESYMNYLKALKSDPGLVKAYSIVNMDLSSGSGLSVGFKRYKEASDRTAGKVADIKDDFYTTLAEMGGNLRSLLDSFALAHSPLDGTLKVFVNNELVTNYAYDAGSRSIKFDINDLPPVGATIKVEYKY